MEIGAFGSDGRCAADRPQKVKGTGGSSLVFEVVSSALL